MFATSSMVSILPIGVILTMASLNPLFESISPVMWVSTKEGAIALTLIFGARDKAIDLVA